MYNFFSLFVYDGVFNAELNEFLMRELAEDGYSGVEVRVTPVRTKIIVRATRTQNVLGEKGRRIRELSSLVQKRFKFPDNSVELYAEKVNYRGLCATPQAESLRYKLLGGLAVRRYISGKLRAQRAKLMKFKDGYMVSAGQPIKEYIDSAVRHILLRQGILFGGSDSTSVALTWTLSILMNHRDVLKKAQEEIDQQVGKDRKVDDLDVIKLVYLKAIVKESIRLCLVGPLTERIIIDDCEIGGFHVKAGSRVVVNIWKMQHDPELWCDDPCEFRPERFLTTNANVELRGQNFELMPFGSGSRMCPGVTFALELMHLTLARLIHGFELGTPGDMKVYMTETSSVTN